MNKTFNYLLELSLYPMFDLNSNYYQGLFQKENNICQNCNNKICENAKSLKDFNVQECHEKLLYLKITLLGKPYILFGIENYFTHLSKNEKKIYKNRIFFRHYKEIKEWKQKVNSLLEKEIQEQEKIDSIFIHDIKKTVSTIYRKIENFIRNNCSKKEDMEKCINESDSDIIGIYKAVKLVDYQFNIIDYLANPESITYGGVKPIKIYKIVDKLVRILQTISPINIKLEGKSHNRLYLYDSFITLVFVILDNAIKYSLNDGNQEVIVSVQDVGSDVEISISSYSPFLSPQSKKEIFTKFYRENTELEGQGIGLYLAKIISDVLQSNIEVHCNENNLVKYNNLEYTTVDFKFFVTNLD